MGYGIFATEEKVNRFQDLAHRCHTLLVAIEGLTQSDRLSAPPVVINHLAEMGAEDILELLDLFDSMTDAGGHHVEREPSTD